jgi:putative Holliday junction resolvase
METAPGRILGVDLGLKRTGLAISDELHLSTRALPNLTPKSRAEDIAFLLSLCTEYEIKTVLIGYPVMPVSGEEGFMGKRARGFYNALGKELPPEIEMFLIEETYTSKEAERRLGKKKAAEKLLDGESARILIETFIHAKNS